tara:strand:- start:9002 stop:9514 length:513 start_codon:yes stop_codon:yes gene_type:complete
MNLVTAEDKTYMKLALEEAARAVFHGEVPVGAVLVHNRTILAKVHNFREAWQDPTAHAEVVAIREAAEKLGTWRLTGACLYSTLEPCTMCAGTIIHARIERLVFGAEDAKAGACGSVFNILAEPRINHSVSVIGGICAQESHDMLQSFFRSRRKREALASINGSRSSGTR